MSKTQTRGTSPGVASKRALLVERLGGPLNALTPQIEGLGYEVVRGSDATAVSGLVASLRRLSLVVVNGDNLRSDPARLVDAIKETHPDLVILWLQANPATPPPSRKITFVAHTPQDLAASIPRFVREEFYAPAFVQQIVDGAAAVLKEFGVPAAPKEPTIKSSLTELSEVTSLLLFYGDGLAGHVIMTASLGDLTHAYRSKFPKALSAGQDDVEDFLGEITNQTAGHVKRFLDPDAGSCRLGLPHFIRGHGTRFRYKAGTPSLSVEFTTPEFRLVLELCMHRLDQGPVRTGGGEGGLQPGVLTFL